MHIYLSVWNLVFVLISSAPISEFPRYHDVLSPPLHTTTHQAVSEIGEFSQKFNPEGKRSDAKEGQVLPGHGPGDLAVDAGN